MILRGIYSLTFAVKYTTVGKIHRNVVPIVASTSKISCNAFLCFRFKTVLRKVCKRKLTLVESDNPDPDFFSIPWLWLLSAILSLAASSFVLERTVGTGERSLNSYIQLCWTQRKAILCRRRRYLLNWTDCVERRTESQKQSVAILIFEKNNCYNVYILWKIMLA